MHPTRATSIGPLPAGSRLTGVPWLLLVSTCCAGARAKLTVSAAGNTFMSLPGNVKDEVENINLETLRR
jgi:hypothetical protein